MARSEVEKHFDTIAAKYDFYTKKRNLHYSSLKKLLKTFIPPGKTIFDVGCGTGDLLASLKPKFGYGMDISTRMIAISKIKYQKSKNLQFSTKWPEKKFDYIFMADVIEHLENPKDIFKSISRLMDKNTTLICIMANPLWKPVLMIAEKLKLKMPEGPHNRIKNHELRIILEEAGLKIVKHNYKLLIPVKIPFITDFANKYLEKWFKWLAFIEYFIAVRA